MGLDQTLYASKHDLSKHDDYDDIEEIAYWRKHPNLQGWMQNLYEERTGIEGHKFNCEYLELSEEDLNNLEIAVLEKKLPATTGFFFGSNADAEYFEPDLEAIAKARRYLAEGYRVFYRPSW